MGKKYILLLILLFPNTLLLSGQQANISTYGVSFISEMAAFRKTVATDSLKRMVELKRLVPDLVYDFRYATPFNFTGKRLYPVGTDITFLRLLPALALQKITDELRKEQLGLKIFDAYRPYSVSIAFWKLIGDERYVAHPSKASNHNRGLAIDLTLIDLRTNQELNMGTGFDHFSDTAHHSFRQLPLAVTENRLKLKTVMEKYGFRSLETEWWHYSWPNDRNYEVLNIRFPKLLH